jgi:nucleoside-diphosphate-sugar epimerase
MRTVLVTGSQGLVGRSLCKLLEGGRTEVRRLDVALPGHADVRDADAVRRAMAGCAGVVHLAAVSRVIWGERDPVLCREVNEGGVANVLRAARELGAWALFASSREVYGEPMSIPVVEDAPLVPVNVYGETKIAGERAVLEAREAGVKTAIVRLSNVYGDMMDHVDRVTPAFARAAAFGEDLRLDGDEHVFDFTHVSDVARGVELLAQALDDGEGNLPTIHLVGGQGTRMRDLAELAVAAGGRGSRVVAGTPRTYDVGRFVGDPRRAERLLGWRATTLVSEGVGRLVRDFAAAS